MINAINDSPTSPTARPSSVVNRAMMGSSGSSGQKGSAPTQFPPKPKLAKPKKKTNFRTILGALVLVLLLVGGGAGLWLSQQSQDVRQQASTGGDHCPAGTTWNGSECETTSGPPVDTSPSVEEALEIYQGGSGSWHP